LLPCCTFPCPHPLTTHSACCSPVTTADASSTPSTSYSSSSSSSSSTSSSQTRSADLLNGFQWQSHWWPVQVSATVDPSRPHAIELLGRQLVLWRDSAEQWHCMEDACPHRCEAIITTLQCTHSTTWAGLAPAPVSSQFVNTNLRHPLLHPHHPLALTPVGSALLRHAPFQPEHGT
jgi:hypothetical protein